MKGFLPGVPSDSMDQMIGLIGAIIMPHNLFLHSGNLCISFNLFNLTLHLWFEEIFWDFWVLHKF